MVVLLPKLEVPVIRIPDSSFIHSRQHPVSAAFADFVHIFERLPYHSRRIGFEVSDNSLQRIWASGSNYQMDVAGHEAIRINFQTFVSLAVLNAFNKYLPVFVTDEYIDPVNHREGDEVKFALISDLIFPAHTSGAHIRLQPRVRRFYAIVAMAS